MSGTFILIVVLVIIILLGKYALSEGQRIERQNRFMRDMESFDTKRTRKKVNKQYSQSTETIIARHKTKLSSELKSELDIWKNYSDISFDIAAQKEYMRLEEEIKTMGTYHSHHLKKKI